MLAALPCFFLELRLQPLHPNAPEKMSPAEMLFGDDLGLLSLQHYLFIFRGAKKSVRSNFVEGIF